MTRMAINDQVRLPLGIAFEVVLQGIRIRLGRSLVTVTGVVLGIAFLMAILTGDVIRRGVAAEDDLRQTVRRMANFLTAEVGPPRERIYGVVVLSPIEPKDIRLLSALARNLRDNGATAVNYAGPELPALAGLVKPVAREQVADGANAVVVFGETAAPGPDWPALLARARNPVLAHTSLTPPARAGGLKLVALQREVRPEEVKKQADDTKKAVFRRRWIVVISLLVTVICISNSMLMSVTERFREIGTMKCLGALSAFIRTMFLIESSLMGVVGSLAGCLLGWGFAVLIYSFTYGSLVFSALDAKASLAHAGLGLVAGMALSIVAAIYPASIASRMVPANALRSNI